MTARLPWELTDHRSVAATLAAETARQIVQGECEAGDLLTESQLAETAAASRTPAREAMLQLERWGLVRLLPKKGALVTQVSPAERRDLLDVRGTWEIRAVQLLAARAVDPDDPTGLGPLIADLRASVEAQQRAVDAQDLLAFAGHDVGFHFRIIAAAGNRVVDELLTGLGPRLARMTWLAVSDGLTAANTFRAEHEALIDLIAAGDATGYAAAIRPHVAARHFAPGGARPGEAAAGATWPAATPEATR